MNNKSTSMRKRKIPHTYVIVFYVIIISAIDTDSKNEPEWVLKTTGDVLS